jgi:membrane-associated phospholipid phosphatase
MLLLLVGFLPLAAVVVVALVFVPGGTVPPGTPNALIWKRKLWELHIGLLGLALSLMSAFFFTQGMKNMFGKPRPDLLDRCQPDYENAAQYQVGGFPGDFPISKLYSADICTQTDDYKLNDGFRSYPSGHSSSAASGLVYLSLFLASKFAVTFPFAVSGRSSSHAAFPSRLHPGDSDVRQNGWYDHSDASSPIAGKWDGTHARHNAKVQSMRKQAAAPPLYLLFITIAPFCVSIFIAASRWWDFRHHGFDILFGYLMGLITAVFAFRYYHLPIQEGAGWAWAPRSSDRAFWAGVGRVGYVTDTEDSSTRHIVSHRSVDMTTAGEASQTLHVPNPSQPLQRPTVYGEGPFDDVEMQRMETGVDNRF